MNRENICDKCNAEVDRTISAILEDTDEAVVVGHLCDICFLEHIGGNPKTVKCDDCPSDISPEDWSYVEEDGKVRITYQCGDCYAKMINDN
jgi:hypothetical protein